MKLGSIRTFRNHVNITRAGTLSIDKNTFDIFAEFSLSDFFFHGAFKFFLIFVLVEICEFFIDIKSKLFRSLVKSNLSPEFIPVGKMDALDFIFLKLERARNRMNIRMGYIRANDNK